MSLSLVSFIDNPESIIILCSFLWFDAASDGFKRILDNELYYKVSVIGKKFSDLLVLKRDFLITIVRHYFFRYSFSVFSRNFFFLSVEKFAFYFSFTYFRCILASSFVVSSISSALFEEHLFAISDTYAAEHDEDEFEPEFDFSFTFERFDWYGICIE